MGIKFTFSLYTMTKIDALRRPFLNWSSIHYRIARLKIDQELNTPLVVQPLYQCSICITRLKGFLVL
ncbi:hypothetical protein ACE6H2_002162 [Prunus campanulata]